MPIRHNLIKITKLLLLSFFITVASGLVQVERVLASTGDEARSVAEVDRDNIKRQAAQDMDSVMLSSFQLAPFAGELNFIYSRKTGAATIILYNNETLARHSYITNLGYLMEYLGINARNKGYYDVRLQGGIYAIKKADVARFIPLSQIKSFPYYENKDGLVVHHVEGNPLVANSWYLTSTLGKAPTWMKQGKKYYSFSGIYFTDTPQKLGKYTQQTNAINRSAPYYDYYLYQPARTKTSFSAGQLNNAFNKLVNNQKTKMTNTGANFIATQNKYGINALLMFTMAIHESNYGRSNFALDRNNLFGVDAVDTNPGAAARFASVAKGIEEQGNYLSWVYADADYQAGANYYGANLGTKSSGMNVKYASDPYWGEKIAHHYARIDRMLGARDYQKYGLAIAPQGTNVYRDAARKNFAHRYKPSTSLLTYMYPVVYYASGTSATIGLEPPYNAKNQVGSRYPAGGTYSWKRGYVREADLIIVNKAKTG
jgi:beta-N-acetylglucosaminidase